MGRSGDGHSVERFIEEWGLDSRASDILCDPETSVQHSLYVAMDSLYLHSKALLLIALGQKVNDIRLRTETRM